MIAGLHGHTMPAGNQEWNVGSRFPATRHSIIERIRAGGSDVRRQAFGDLVQGYWKPVYTHLRLTWRLDPDDAQDATQAFFAEAYEKEWLERFEPAKAKFRTFVRICADRFVKSPAGSVASQAGGGIHFIALDFGGAERDTLARLASRRLTRTRSSLGVVRALFGAPSSQCVRNWTRPVSHRSLRCSSVTISPARWRQLCDTRADST